MENANHEGSGKIEIHDLLDRYLASRKTLKSSAAETSMHLDEDSLAAFAEGTLSHRESTPVVRHLVECGFCRHKTAELVRLDLEFAETDFGAERARSSEPSRISTVLGELFSKIFGTTEGAVFAHEEKNDEEKPSADEKRTDEDI
jgi:hypothetical protein